MSKNNFAVILTGGKQYKVRMGGKLRVERIIGKVGDVLKFNEVLLKSDGAEAEIGAPRVAGAVVEAEILNQGRDDKKIIFRYHSKTRYRKLKGHRQEHTEIRIKSIK